MKVVRWTIHSGMPIPFRIVIDREVAERQPLQYLRKFKMISKSRVALVAQKVQKVVLKAILCIRMHLQLRSRLLASRAKTVWKISTMLAMKEMYTIGKIRCQRSRVNSISQPQMKSQKVISNRRTTIHLTQPKPTTISRISSEHSVHPIVK